MQNRWEGIEEFIAVVDCAQFSAAAVQLGVSKAHVSQQISKLESRLGTRLLQRTTRKISLTESGEYFLSACRPILEQLETAESAVSTIQSELKGRLRLSAPHLLGEVLLMPIITQFQHLHPLVSVDIDLTSHRVNLLEEGYDVAIQLGTRDDINVVNKKIGSTHFHVVASPEYIEKYGAPKTPSDLKNHHCLLFANRGKTKPWKFTCPEGQFNIAIQSHWRSNSGHMLRAAAIKGMGLAYLPYYYLTEALAQKQLVVVMADLPPVQKDIVAICQSRTLQTAKIQFFIDHLLTHFKT